MFSSLLESPVVFFSFFFFSPGCLWNGSGMSVFRSRIDGRRYDDFKTRSWFIFPVKLILRTHSTPKSFLDDPHPHKKRTTRNSRDMEKERTKRLNTPRGRGLGSWRLPQQSKRKTKTERGKKTNRLGFWSADTVVQHVGVVFFLDFLVTVFFYRWVFAWS